MVLKIALNRTPRCYQIIKQGNASECVSHCHVTVLETTTNLLKLVPQIHVSNLLLHLFLRLFSYCPSHIVEISRCSAQVVVLQEQMSADLG